jgi:hypothetical protein
MLADCADPCIRSSASKLLASAVAAANFMFMLSLLLGIGLENQLIITREVAYRRDIRAAHRPWECSTTARC